LTPRQRLLLFALCSFALIFQYLYNLNGVGVLEPDEPRYAAIGQAMAHSGDWVTPRLWGTPWFEKPALLYWMTAIGFDAGLGPDAAGRVPVAILSLAFLALWFLLLKREFGFEAAAIATGTLATCAGWFVYSGLCLTDVPMAAFFSLGVAITLRIVRGGDRPVHWVGLGAAIGLAALAKGLVPLVLSAPLLWFLKERWRRWWIALLALIVAAGPWYFLVTHANGAAFLNVFFWQQQFSRMYSASLQHVRPFYFYVPVLLGVLFPWTPLLAVLRPGDWKPDRRLRCLAAVVLFGFVFFSASINKLPGYVLPLLPALLALVGVAAAKRRVYSSRAWLLACAALVAITPFAGRMVPYLLTSRLSSFGSLLLQVLPITAGMIVLFATPFVVAAYARKSVAASLLFLSMTVAVIEVKSSIYPVLDQQASPRGFWREIASQSDKVCDAGLHRAWQYGLAFYRGSVIPPCGESPQPIHLIQDGQHRAQRVVNGKVIP
jgi:4-amino-4-deoxy-L-arabinose transferase-like glycosyltransferase